MNDMNQPPPPPPPHPCAPLYFEAAHRLGAIKIEKMHGAVATTLTSEEARRGWSSTHEEMSYDGKKGVHVRHFKHHRRLWSWLDLVTSALMFLVKVYFRYSSGGGLFVLTRQDENGEIILLLTVNWSITAAKIKCHFNMWHLAPCREERGFIAALWKCDTFSELNN